MPETRKAPGAMRTPAAGRLRVAEIWRYPVKSLRGEQLREAAVSSDGIPGDRVVHVRGARGLLTGRTRSRLLTLTAQTGTDGEPLVEGHPWNRAEAAAFIAAAAGADARLVRDDARERFDVLPLLVATDSEIARLGTDRRRLRPNIVIAGALARAEREWPDHALRIGDVLIGVHSLRPRCIVTTIDPDTGAQDLDVFRRIRSEFDGSLALNCWVINGGTIRVGEPIDVVPLPREIPPDATARPGGWVTGMPYPSPAGYPPSHFHPSAPPLGDDRLRQRS